MQCISNGHMSVGVTAATCTDPDTNHLAAKGPRVRGMMKNAPETVRTAKMKYWVQIKGEDCLWFWLSLWKTLGAISLCFLAGYSAIVGVFSLMAIQRIQFKLYISEKAWYCYQQDSCFYTNLVTEYTGYKDLLWYHRIKRLESITRV